MGNCLYKELKGTVNKDLIKYGELRFTVNIDSSKLAPFLIKSTKPVTCTITGDGHFYKGTPDSQTNVTTVLENKTSTSGYRISGGRSTISIIEKYELTEIVLASSSVDPLAYNDVAFDFSVLECNETPISNLQMCFRGVDDLLPVYLDIDKVNFSSLTSFAICNISAKGDISNIARNLGQYTECAIGLPSQLAMTELTGSLEEFVRNINSEAFNRSAIVLQANNYGFHEGILNVTVNIETDSQGNATIKKRVDSSTLATYNRQSDTFTYYDE